MLLFRRMMEGFKRVARGAMFGAGMMAGGEAMAGAPHVDAAAHHEKVHASWEDAGAVQFDRDMASGNVDAMVDDVKKFVREYNFPTQGKIIKSGDNNPMRVTSKHEWQHIGEVAQHMLDSYSAWDKHPFVRASLQDVLDRNAEQITPRNEHDTLRYYERTRQRREVQRGGERPFAQP